MILLLDYPQDTLKLLMAYYDGDSLAKNDITSRFGQKKLSIFSNFIKEVYLILEQKM